MTQKQKEEKAKKIIKAFRKEQHIVFTKHQEILKLKDEVYGHEMVKHYYEVKFITMFGKNWKFIIQDLEKQLF